MIFIKINLLLSRGQKFERKFSFWHLIPTLVSNLEYRNIKREIKIRITFLKMHFIIGVK